MAYTVKTTNRFDKNLAKMKKRGLPMDVFKEVVCLLMANGRLPLKYKPLSPHTVQNANHNRACLVYECLRHGISGEGEL